MATMSVYVLGGLAVMNGEMTVGMLVAYQTLVTSFTRPFGNLVNFGGMLQELQGDMNRLDDVLNYPQDEQYSRITKDAQTAEGASIKLSGKIELRDVSFVYEDGDEPTLRHIDLTINKGEVVTDGTSKDIARETGTESLEAAFHKLTGIRDAEESARDVIAALDGE